MKESILQIFKSQDMVEFLATLDIHPKKKSNGNYWYCSPLRIESTPSFKVSKGNTGIDLFWDYGTGAHGNLVDFCCLYYEITPKELFEQLQSTDNISFFVQHPNFVKTAGQKENNPTTTIVTPIMKIESIRDLHHPVLLKYLEHDRKVSIDIAKLHCKEIHYSIGNNSFFAIGFPNEEQGFEIRNAVFKGCISPKTYSLISGGHNTVNIFEGFIDFLSYLQIQKIAPDSLSKIEKPSDFLILNSLAMIDSAKSVISKYTTINLFLDRDEMGLKESAKLLLQFKQARDRNSFFNGAKDINDWLVQQSDRISHNQHKGRSIKW